MSAATAMKLMLALCMLVSASAFGIFKKHRHPTRAVTRRPTRRPTRHPTARPTGHPTSSTATSVGSFAVVKGMGCATNHRLKQGYRLPYSTNSKTLATSMCKNDLHCQGVYDLHCSGKGPFYLCGSNSSSVTASQLFTHMASGCVYKKGGGTTAAQRCSNLPFMDTYGTCTIYSQQGWCTGGKQGAAWQASWGAISTKAKAACCSCGGGKKSRPTAVTTQSTYQQLMACLHKPGGSMAICSVSQSPVTGNSDPTAAPTKPRTHRG